MKMEPYATTPLIQIYWLPDVRAGYGVWTGVPTLWPTREALSAAEALLTSRGSTRWISNTRHAFVSPPETQKYVTTWLRQMRARGALRAWADLPPRSSITRLKIDRLGSRLGAESAEHGVCFAQFDTLEVAKAWIATR